MASRKTFLRDSVVLITGASSGIGEELARLCAPHAKTLVIVARRRDRLDTLAASLRAASPSLRVEVRECDVTDLGAIDAMLEAVHADIGQVDVLINNAGLGDLGVFDLSSWTKAQQMIALNVTSLTYLAHRLVGGMVARGRGGILNISSGFGLSFMPGMAVYVGTKHYVTGFTESLRLDVKGTGVHVSQCCPGPVRTEFESHAGNFTGMDTPALMTIDATTCAESALDGLTSDRALTIPGIVMKFVMWMTVWSPRWAQRLVLGFLAGPLRKKHKEFLAQKTS